MKPRCWSTLLAAICSLCVPPAALSHPSSGIVVNEQGEVFFVHSGRGLARLDRDGKLTYVIQVKDCDANPPPDGLPGFQGLAVTTNGTVYAAATGCRAVVKISPDGMVETLLKAERPWSPTSVAINGATLYLLEWTNPNDAPETGWRPRVRKVAAGGKVTTLVTIEENFPVNRQR